jgi:GGDEF domain-containing protein
VLVIDINRFGRLNACMGSLVGDELLITVARRLKGVEGDAHRSFDIHFIIGQPERRPKRAIDAVGQDMRNRFGRLNACMGSLVGDELLITVARRLKGALRSRGISSSASSSGPSLKAMPTDPSTFTS